MSDFKEFYNRFSAQLIEARKQNNPSDFRSLLYVVEPDWDTEDQPIFVEYSITKAGLFALFGESLDIDDWMLKALSFSKENERTEVYFKWINLYWKLAQAISDQAKLQAAFSSLYNISSQALEMKLGKYDEFAFQSVRVFTLAALGKHEVLEEELSKLKWEPIPPKLLQDKEKLNYFYLHFYKVLIAALEIRSELYVSKALFMITIDDSLILSKAPLSRIFNTVVMDIADMRPEFAADFNTFYQLRKKWAGFLPNFSLFTMMIEEENLKGLDYFFKGFEA